jgi:hypothetical protein
MASVIGRNLKHWIVRIEEKDYLSHQSDVADAIFSACRRHAFNDKKTYLLIEVTAITRPINVPFKTFQHVVETTA